VILDGLTGPVAGFAGSLRDQTDLELLAQAAALAPDLNFVLVGPVMTGVKRLAHTSSTTSPPVSCRPS
jgi:hypothetical protein